MSNGLYSGASGLALGTGLYRNAASLWGNASGLDAGFGGSWSPLSLFAASEPGAWYDPSDLSTMFQDSAGTTPVTATGQTVGRILDKSGRGNHATQANLGQRPIYGIEPFGGRRNLLTYTEQFDNAAWTKDNATVVGDTLTDNATLGAHAVTQGVTPIFAPTFPATAFAVVKAGTGSFAYLTFSDAGNRWAIVVLDLSTGQITQQGTASLTTILSTSVTALGDGWYKLTLSAVNPSSGALTTVKIGIAPAASGNVISSGGVISYSGSGQTIKIQSAQVETGSAATAYQRVTDQWNVTQTGVPSVSYLAFDGSDDFLVSSTITPGTDKAQVFAGVRKLSDTLAAILVESSVTSNSNFGTFNVLAPQANATANFSTLSRGTAPISINQTAISSSSYAAPVSAVLSATHDIAASLTGLRVNTVQMTPATGAKGTGNFLAYPLYIGRRGGTTLPFNGRLYSLIVRFGPNLDAATITNAETWVNQKTGAY